ncbi:hypothetical protein [Fodinibius sp.]|uniref:hypothetical protein n=1 Tax=Fodinibius sp. TaxID=1872440 RepID=UPI002ACD8BAC|nr:hypothetical protein [Fodinibius sp.]MDZ7660524.1 hypothetical protein [Fodinibius sp.]
MRQIFIFISFLMGTGLFVIGPLHAQQSREMLLFEIEDNRYQKCNYNKEGEVQSFEKFIVGSIEENANTYRLQVELYSYNAEGQLKDSTRTIYTCQPEERSVLLNIFPFTDYGKGSEIKVNVEDDKAFYPVNPETGWEMKPIEFSLKIDKGLVGFLGGNSKITISDRQVAANDTLQAGQYQINSTVELGVYVVGIKVKGFGYRIAEIVDKDLGIIWQKFTSIDDGSYFVIRLL